MRRTSRNTATLTPRSAGTMDRMRATTYPRTAALSRYAIRRGAGRSLPFQPDRAESVVVGREVLLVLDGRLHDIDRVGRECPDLDRLVDHQTLRLVVDLLALLRIERGPALIQQHVDVGVAVVVPLLLDGVEAAVEERVGIRIARRRVHRQVEIEVGLDDCLDPDPVFLLDDL